MGRVSRLNSKARQRVSLCETLGEDDVEVYKLRLMEVVIG